MEGTLWNVVKKVGGDATFAKNWGLKDKKTRKLLVYWQNQAVFWYQMTKNAVFILSCAEIALILPIEND